jgi:membrane fusion protein, type I secretion system
VYTRPNSSMKLVPGMPVETFMKTYDRTVISYFTKPLQDQILRAFRER